MWSYVDARDCGEACRLAVEKALPGHERFIIAAADTMMDVPSAELMATYFPDVPIRTPLVGYEAIYSIRKAQSLLGYAPRFGWRTPDGV